MKTTGQILQATRLQKKFELDDISRITRIRRHFLEAIEADDYQSLPSGTIARGFIRNYAEFLKLDPSQVLSIFRRDFVENEQGKVVPRGMVNPVTEISFWTPRTTLIAAVTLILTLFGAYLFYQYRILTGPPSLQVTQPQANQTVTDYTAEISGRTDPEATLTVNDQPVVLEKGGRFYLRLPVNPGTNIITIVATSKSGKSATITRTVIY